LESGEGYTFFELEVEKAELVFGLLAQLFEDQWKITAGESSLSSIYDKAVSCSVLASS